MMIAARLSSSTHEFVLFRQLSRLIIERICFSASAGLALQRKVRSLVPNQVLQLLKYPKTGNPERKSDVNSSKLLRCQK